MPGRAEAGPGIRRDPWQPATVVAIRDETPRAKTFRLMLARPVEHLAGQHYVVRLTAPDGYTASRSYSVASAPDGSAEIELTVERLAGGEVSTFLHDVVVPGDEIEVRGPIGGWFVWRGDTPALLVGGGSGVVPLMAMLRLARRTGRAGRAGLVRLVVSVRSVADLYYADELPGPEATVVYSRQAPPGVERPPGRIGRSDLEAAVLPGATGYVCGSSGFADAASRLVVELGVPVEQVRVERFGPTGWGQDRRVGSGADMSGYIVAPRDLLGDSIVKLVITNGIDVANVTHLGRGPTVAQRIALLWNSPGCDVQGCSSTIGVDADHRVPWADDQVTELPNLDHLCGHHHYLKTHHGWALIPGTGKRPMVPPGDPRHPGHPHRSAEGGGGPAPEATTPRDSPTHESTQHGDAA